MELFDRAAQAHAEHGEEGYWKVLTTPPRESTAKPARKRMSSGYTDEGDRSSSSHEGSGHASDQILPLDKVFKR